MLPKFLSNPEPCGKGLHIRHTAKEKFSNFFNDRQAMRTPKTWVITTYYVTYGYIGCPMNSLVLTVGDIFNRVTELPFGSTTCPSSNFAAFAIAEPANATKPFFFKVAGCGLGNNQLPELFTEDVMPISAGSGANTIYCSVSLLNASLR
jgi:hypothetical protein